MISDAAIEAWLDTNSHVRPSIVTPYVQSPVDMTLQYRLHVRREGRSGKSTITQGGTVNAPAQTPAALGNFAISVAQDDQCTVTLTLSDAGLKVGEYQFDCPR